MDVRAQTASVNTSQSSATQTPAKATRGSTHGITASTVSIDTADSTERIATVSNQQIGSKQERQPAMIGTRRARNLSGSMEKQESTNVSTQTKKPPIKDTPPAQKTSNDTVVKNERTIAHLGIRPEGQTKAKTTDSVVENPQTSPRSATIKTALSNLTGKITKFTGSVFNRTPKTDQAGRTNNRLSMNSDDIQTRFPTRAELNSQEALETQNEMNILVGKLQNKDKLTDEEMEHAEKILGDVLSGLEKGKMPNKDLLSACLKFPEIKADSPIKSSINRKTDALKVANKMIEKMGELKLKPFFPAPLVQKGIGKSPVNFEGNPALKNPGSEPYKINTGSAQGMLRCKGYIKENEICADVIGIHEFDTHRIAIVADAAGNKPGSHQAAKFVENKLSTGLNECLAKYGHDPEQFKASLSSLMASIHDDIKVKTKDQGWENVTAAFSLQINMKSGNQMLLGGTIGDCRILYKNANGTAENKTPTPYNRPLSDSNGAFGNTGNKITNGGEPFSFFIQEMKQGDLVILGSDGMGDNLEAKTLGQSPKSAYDELKEKGLAPTLANPESLSADISSWEGSKDKNVNKDDIQKIHDAYINMKAQDLIQGSSNPINAIFDHCVKSDAVTWGADYMKIDKKAGKEQANNELKELAGRIATKLGKENELDSAKSGNTIDAFVTKYIMKPDDLGIVALSAG